MTDISKRAREAMEEKLCREGKGELPESRMMSGITSEDIEKLRGICGNSNLNGVGAIIVSVDTINKLLDLAEAALEQPAEVENTWDFDPKDAIAQEPAPNPTPPEGELMDRHGIGSVENYLLETAGDHDRDMIKRLCNTARAAHTYSERCEELERRNTDTACDRDHFMFEHESTLEAFDRESGRLRKAKDRITALEEHASNCQEVRERDGKLITDLQSRLTKAQEALRFYAKEWQTVQITEEDGQEPGPATVMTQALFIDQGSRARAALEEGE